MSSVKSGLIIGYDFGTSSVKAALFDPNGGIIASDQAAYPVKLPREGWAEQVPDDWWNAMALCTKQVIKKANVDSSDIKAIGISAQMGGTIPVNKSGEHLYNCLIWLDTRSATISKKITQGFPKISGYGLSNLLRWLWLTNGAPSLSGKDPISKILWIKEQLPDIWIKTHKFLDVKDYLLHRLCGNFVTSEDCAHLTWLMDNRKGKRQWSKYLSRRVGINTNLLPEIKSSTEVAGKLTRKAAEEIGLSPNTLIVTGVSDVNACALGSGDISNNAIHLCVGTSSWLAAHQTNRAVDIASGTATLCAADHEKYLLIAAQELAGGCINWAVQNLFDLKTSKSTFSHFDQLAQNSKAGANGLFFFPWLFGERVPVDNPYLRGGFANLSISHDSADMARAILEGVALNTRWAMPAIQRITANKDQPIRFLGGAAKSDLWCQIFSDVLQRPIIQMQSPELGGCTGAAMTAAVGAGIFSSLEDSSIMCKTEKTFVPNRSLAPLFEEKIKFFKTYYQRTHSWHLQFNKDVFHDD